MKKYLFACILLLMVGAAFAQPGKKPAAKQKAPAQKEIDKMMEDEMKGMSEDEKAEMRKMMKGMMPALQEHNNTIADYPEFTSNKQLVPKKDAGRIAAMSKKKLLQADMAAYSSTLFNKIIKRGGAAEIALAKKIIAQNPKANVIGGAAVLCMLQGYPQAAMALSMKAVQADPSNVNWQNNMASLLTHYGYPEQAIPVLQKLKNQFPRNSTVLNNLGLAWLGLGETDSAMANIKRAGGLNPNHPEAKETEGVIEEVTGNTDKATEDYVKAMENAASPFTEILIKNNKGQNKLDKIDFEKLKRSITIYEYFPKDWIKIPVLYDNVSAYENNMSIKNGFNKMFEELNAKIEAMAEASSAEVAALLEDSVSFVKTMIKENKKGVNMMSKPAGIVQNILQAYLNKWMADYTKQSGQLMENMNTKHMEMTKSGNNDKCPDFDKKNNAFLVYANPLIRNFYSKKIEEFRMWLNAFCTWSWYMTGNPKNTILTACIAWTAAITGMYEGAIHDQYAIEKSCVKQNGDAVTNIPVPAIPNFTCPAIVSIPVGADWQQLSNAAKNFDNNTSGAKQNAKNAVPNGSTAYGADGNTIAQAGRAPFTKIANGSITPGMINDNELTPLSKIPLDDLTPLPKIPLDDLTPLPKISPDDLTPLPDLRKSKLAKELLKKMMSADCKNVKSSKDILKEQLERMMKGVKELEAYEHIIEQIEKLESEIEQKETNAQKKEQLKKQIEKMQQETDKMDKYEQLQQSKKEMEKIMKEMDAMDDKKFMKDKFDKIIQAVDEMEAAPAILKGIQQNGLQPSISSGIQAPGAFSPVKGLFN